MLRVGRLQTTDCCRVNRRELMQVGAISTLGLTTGVAAQAADTSTARSVILLWLWGGPSHLDTFDPKPQAPIEYRGPYAPIETCVPGIQICELLPGLSRMADRYAVMRSMHHASPDHGIAGTIGLTGSSSGAISLSGKREPGNLEPTHGAVVTRLLGSPNNVPITAAARSLPAFFTVGGSLHQGKRRIAGERAARLGSLHDPFRLDVDAESAVELPQLELADGISPDGLQHRQRLLDAVDHLRRGIGNARSFRALEDHYDQAFSLLTNGQARQVFDLQRESEQTRLRYGKFRFGQCCLLARRLIEANARFVQVNWSSHVEPVEDTGDGGWDMHDRNFQQLQDRHAWMLDQSVTALLLDLDACGLLSETLVIAIGEFGRTPKINAKAGRDHWNQCYSGIVAGGGVHGGQVIGASDRRGEHPALRPILPADLARTVYHCLGIDGAQMTDAGLTPTGSVIEELV